MAAVDEILVAIGPGESRFALLADGVPVEFRIDRGGAAAGDLVLGRILSVNRGLSAAFVDIGEDRPGMLASPGGRSEGQAVPVQVTAAARGSKGAALTAQPSLQGRLLAYTPSRRGLNLSRRIADQERRKALTALLAPLLAPDEGLVVRTEAAAAPDDALCAELAALRERWRRIDERMAKAVPPSRLEDIAPLTRLLAEFPDVRTVLADDRATLAEINVLAPHAACDEGVFEARAGDSLDQALDRSVPLPGGGALIIEPAAAFTAIDVDSGGGAPLAANLAAVPEIARQIRLRGLAGHILVDIIPLKDRQAMGRLLASLRAAVAADPTPTHVIGTTPLGLIEMTRERRRPTLAEMMLADEGPRRSPEALAAEALRALLKAALACPQAAVALRAAPAVAAVLARWPGALDEVRRRLGRPLAITSAPELDRFEIIEGTP